MGVLGEAGRGSWRASVSPHVTTLDSKESERVRWGSSQHPASSFVFTSNMQPFTKYVNAKKKRITPPPHPKSHHPPLHKLHLFAETVE